MYCYQQKLIFSLKIEAANSYVIMLFSVNSIKMVLMLPKKMIKLHAKIFHCINRDFEPMIVNQKHLITYLKLVIWLIPGLILAPGPVLKHMPRKTCSNTFL